MKTLLYHLAAETKRPIIMEVLIDKPLPKVLQGLASNSNVSSEHLQQIFSYSLDNACLDGCLARHPLTPPPVLAYLGASKYRAVVEEVVANKNTPHATLIDLINNPNTPNNILEHIMHHHADPEIQKQARAQWGHCSTEYYK